MRSQAIPCDRHADWMTVGVLVALWLSQVGINLLWLKVDTRPPFWDMAGHAVAALRVAQLPFVTNPPAAFRGLLTMSGYPPLVYVLSAPLAIIFWPTVDALLGVNALFLGILFLSTYGVARSIGGRAAGLLAAFIVSMYPIVYGLSRHYLLEVPLVAMVALAVWLLVRTESLERRGTAIAFGLSLGLGMLTKWTFAIFVSGPLMVEIIHALASHKRSLSNLALALGVGATVAAPWYLSNLSNLPLVVRTAALYGRAQGDPSVGLEAWLYYVWGLMHDQVLLPLALFFVLGLIVWMATHKFQREVALLLGWIVLPYLAFSAFEHKDVRFTMPYLPAMAVITALGLARIRPLSLRWGLMVILALYAVFEFVGLSWGTSSRLPVGLLPSQVSVRIGSTLLPVYAETVHIASPPRNEDWQAQAVIRDVKRSGQGASSAKPITLVVLPDAPYFEYNVFAYYALIEHLPIHALSVTGPVQVDDARERILTSDYVVAKSGNQGPPWSVQNAELFAHELHDPTSELGRQFELVGTYGLPDGAVGELWRKL